MVSTYISFYLNSNRIHVFVDALRGIGSPNRICFMIEPDGKRILMLPHTKKDFISHGVPLAVYSGTDSLKISSKKLCRIFAGQHNWDLSRSYRVPGVVITEKCVAVYDLTKAEMINKSSYTRFI